MGRPEEFTSLLAQVESIDIRGLGLTGALEFIMPAVAEHFHAEFASLLVLDRETRELRFEYAMGAPLEDFRKVRLRLGEGIAGAVALGRRTSRLADAQPVAQHSKVVDRMTGHVTRSLLAVPLIWGDEVLGVMEILNRLGEPPEFSAEDAAEARALAGILAPWVAFAGESRATGAIPAPSRTSALPEGPLLVGTHRVIREVLDLVLRVAPTDDPILVLGETGTGKELIARRLHHASPRAGKPLVVLNCAALSETLLESHLFGHVRGAFTDAREDRVGAFVQADGGTLFLDEVGEMSPACQAKFLRVLEGGEVTPVGGSEPRHVDVRIVAATNRDLAVEVHGGRFRQDLFYRLRGIEIQLPPLRERREDIPLLAEFFLRMAAERKGKRIRGFEPALLDLLCRAPWPGNVRELRHAVESLVTLAQGEILALADLPASLRADLEREAVRSVEGNLSISPAHADEEERRAILEALARTKYPGTGRWNIARAARELGMSRKTLEYRIKRVHRLQDAQNSLSG
jgi:transcriptional regulator with GAF, ATPase, and Fis domain